jgi:hypothetical protein
MPPSASSTVVNIEQTAPYRTISRFSMGPSPAADNRPARVLRPTLLGLPARTPVITLGDGKATLPQEHQDAA